MADEENEEPKKKSGLVKILIFVFAGILLVAAGLGGHARVGFENNIQLLDGGVAANNGALINQVAEGIGPMGRHIASGFEARSLLGMQ